MLRSSVRTFSTVPARQSILDYFKFYKKKEAGPKVRSTEEVVSETKKEEGTGKIPILGRRNPRHYNKKVIRQNLKGFTIPFWIPKSEDSVYSKALSQDGNYKSAISSVLKEIYVAKIEKAEPEKYGTVSLDDLQQRFEILKEVQQKFAVEIPDPQIARLGSFVDIESFLQAKLDPSRPPEDELIPDKVYFDPTEFEGTNVSVGEFKFEKQKDKEMKKLLKKAKKFQQKEVE